MNNFDNYHKRIEQTLARLLNQTEIPAPRIREAMHYAIFSGGKRMRPLLVYLCGELINTDITQLDILAAAIEYIHCYSLIHDDLPAMDNDDFRRGKPSCHRAFDEATAILVGDGLQAFAIDILIQNLPNTLAPKQVLAVVSELVKACGPSGMVSGQSLDLSELAKSNITPQQLCNIHQLKTGKLFQACIKMVLHTQQLEKTITHALENFASHLGLVFQMQDDYLDHYDHATHVGKKRSSDLINQKTTFATVFSQHELKNQINKHFTLAKQELRIFDAKAHTLIILLDTIAQRLENF